MRLFLFLLLVSAIPSFAGLKLVAVAGYSGYVSPVAAMPIAITVVNDGGDLKGEFILTQGNLQSETRICKEFYFPAVIPANSKQLRFIYCNSKEIQNNFKLSFISKGATAASTMVTARQFSTNDRFVLSAGGHGLDFMNGDVFNISTNQNPNAAPGGVTKSNKIILPAAYKDVTNGNEGVDNSYSYNYRYGGYNNGDLNILTGSVEPEVLPDNAEGYRGAEILYLPSNVTENSFNSPKVKEAIIGWVSNGGCLIIGNGGIPGRLDTPFFKTLLPAKGKKVKLLGIGKVVLLDFDPELAISAEQKSLLRGISYSLNHSSFFTYQLANSIDMMPSSVKPPSISAIMFYLVIYILVVSPVNYFILKKIDKRELAWKTTPIIAVLFTLIAFTIGLVSKGLNLYVNSISVVHSSVGQKTAVMNSMLSVYSPASRSYKVSIGDDGLYGMEKYNNVIDNYTGYNNNQESVKSIRYAFQNSVFSVDDFQMDMWSQRKLMFTNQVSLGNGITAEKVKDGFYKITNGTDMDIDRGVVYNNNIPLSYFSVKSGKSVISQPRDQIIETDNKDFNRSYESVNSRIPEYLNGVGTVNKIVCYSKNGNPDISVSGKRPTAALTVLILNVN